MQILVVNSGSSSIKFSIFAVDANASNVDPLCLMTGQLKGVGTGQSTLEFRLGDESNPLVRSTVDAPSLTHATAIVIDTISASNMPKFEAAGYRVVHPGPNLRQHELVTPHVMHELEHSTAFAPLHNPETVKLIKTFIAKFSKIPHYVCFDTIFHETMPEAATTYPLPQQYTDKGIRRYGAHGLSCESIVVQLRAVGDVPHRMAIAHLGSGCSVTALIDGKSVDTSMGMTPTGGVVMGTRSGDLDPGLVLYLLRDQKHAADDAVTAVETILNQASGMVALSGMPNDVRAISKAANDGNQHAKLALSIFTRSITKAIGSYCWLLGGLDAIVFSGGIGEHDSQIRTQILGNLQALGIDIDEAQNRSAGDGSQRISTPSSATSVFVVPAQEDFMIAIHVRDMAQQRTTQTSYQLAHS